MTRSLVRVALAALAVGLAVWLIPASLFIVDWPRSGPVRIALIAPRLRLWLVLAISLTVAALAAAIVGRRGSAALARAADVTTPLLLLGLWAVPFLPWLPDRLPLLLVLAGPLRWAIGAAALAGVALALRGPDRRSWLRVVPTRRKVFLCSFAFYVVFGLQHQKAIGLGGDEPHYLILAHSLLVDHDLDVANNHERGDYRAFFPAELRPDFLQRGLHGEIYSIHAPGLALVLVPGYAAAGVQGAILTAAAIAALTALAVFDLAALIAGSEVAWLTWVAVCLTVPFIPHSWLLYPEMAGGLIVAWAVLWTWKPVPERAMPWLWRGAALAALPWLHTKFVILLGCLTIVLLARLRLRIRETVAFLTAIAVSLVLWVFSFYRMYGVFDPQAPYGTYPDTYILTSNIPRSLLGLLFDQKFGILAYSPVYALAVAGGWVMWRRRQTRAFAAALAVTTVAFAVSSARLYMWWGGSSAPARFLVPVLPLAAPMIAVGVERLRQNAAGRSVVLLALVASLVPVAAGLAFPERLFLFSEPHGYARLVEEVQASAPLGESLPTFTNEDWRTPFLQILPWLVAVASGLAVIWMWPRSHNPARSLYWRAVLGTIAFGAAASLTAASPDTRSRSAVVIRGQTLLMQAYDGPRLHAIDYRTWTRLSDQALLAGAAFVVRRDSQSDVSDPRRLEGPFELPPGRYQSRLWFDGQRAPSGDAFIALKNGVVAVHAADGLSNPTTLDFDLPVAAAVLVGVSGEDVAKDVRRIDLGPQRLLPASERPSVNVRAIESIAGRPNAYIVYADENTYPEGGVYWTRDTRAGSVFVAPAGASQLVITLHVGPSGGVVRLGYHGGEGQNLELSPDETRRIAFPVPAGAELVRIEIQSSRAFRPADVDRLSNDDRMLGCQVRIELADQAR